MQPIRQGHEPWQAVTPDHPHAAGRVAARASSRARSASSRRPRCRCGGRAASGSRHERASRAPCARRGREWPSTTRRTQSGSHVPSASRKPSSSASDWRHASMIAAPYPRFCSNTIRWIAVPNLRARSTVRSVEPSLTTVISTPSRPCGRRCRRARRSVRSNHGRDAVFLVERGNGDEQLHRPPL